MRPNSASWLRNITHGSEEHNDTAGRNARFGGSTSPFNRGSMRSLQGASNASRGTRRQTYSDPRSPSSARFALSPSAAPTEAPPLPTYPSLFTRDEDSFKAWIQTQAPPECVMSALEDEPMSGAEFKMHTTDGDKIHTSATTHLMELWPGVPRKFCGKLMITIERELERHKTMKAGSTPMSVKDLAAISFQAMPQGKAEGGKLQTEQLKHYYLSIISRIDEMQEFHDYAEGLQWFMETNPDPEVAIRFLKERCNCSDLQLDRHLGTILIQN